MDAGLKWLQTRTSERFQEVRKDLSALPAGMGRGLSARPRREAKEDRSVHPRGVREGLSGRLQWAPEVLLRASGGFQEASPGASMEVDLDRGDLSEDFRAAAS